MENLFRSVLNAEQKAAAHRDKSRILHNVALHVRTTVGHAYVFFDELTRQMEQVVYVYEQAGKFMLPLLSGKYHCDTLVEAEGHLHDWAVQSGVITSAFGD